MQNDLDMASRNVREARAVVERQQQMIEYRKERGLDCELSQSLLATFKVTLAGFERGLARLTA